MARNVGAHNINVPRTPAFTPFPFLQLRPHLSTEYPNVFYDVDLSSDGMVESRRPRHLISKLRARRRYIVVDLKNLTVTLEWVQGSSGYDFRSESMDGRRSSASFKTRFGIDEREDIRRCD